MSTRARSSRFGILAFFILLAIASGSVLTATGASPHFAFIDSLEEFFGYRQFHSESVTPPTVLATGTCDLGGSPNNIEVESTGGTALVGYSTLELAVAAINAGTHTGTITIDVCGNTAESGTSMVLNRSGSGASSYSSIIMKPAGGTARTISGDASASPFLDLNGADNVTIDGLNSAGNSLTITNTSIFSTAGVSTIRFINDATNNTIQNATINGSGTGSTTGTIIFGAGVTSGTGNDGNIIANNNIGAAGTNLPTNAIYSAGNGPTTENNSGVQVTGNQIFDYFNASASSNGINLASGNNTWTISGNKFYQTGTRTFAGTFTHRAVWIQSGSGYVVSGNTIGFASAAGTGTYTLTGSTSGAFVGIELNVGTSGNTSVQNNTVAGLSLTTNSASSSGSGVFSGIYASSGNVDIGTTTGNTVGSASGTGSITVTTSSNNGKIFGITSGSSNTIDISNNTIGSITTAGSTASALNNLVGIQVTAGTNTISANLVGSTTTANSLNVSNPVTTATANGESLTGIATSSSTSANITNNTIANLNNAYAGTSTSGLTFGISATAGTNIISGNSVHDISSSALHNASGAATLAGISQSSTLTSQSISQNTIYSLSNPVLPAGIILNANSPSVLVSRNLIHTITASTSGASPTGIYIKSGASTVFNNMIRLGLDAAGGSITSSLFFTGITKSSTGISSIYFNTVFIGGSGVASGTGVTYGLNRSAAPSSGSDDIRDNVFINSRSNASSGGSKHYAYFVQGSSPAITSDYNLYFASGIDGSMAGYFNGSTTSNYSNLSGLQGSVIAQDIHSANSDALLKTPNGTASTLDLHLSSISSPAANIGVAIGSVPTDFDNDTRSNPPDIGADEVTSMQFSSSSYSAFENVAGGIVTVTVSRTANTGNAATVAYATSAGAINPATVGTCGSGGADYQAAAGTLNFAINDTSKTFNVTICPDSTIEPDETINLTLNSPTGSIIGSPGGSVLTIANDDLAPVTSVSYNGNGNTGGSVPVDGVAHTVGSTVTVLGNTGSLTRTGYIFAGWNTQADGLGTDYAPASTFTINADTTLYAKWQSTPLATDHFRSKDLVGFRLWTDPNSWDTSHDGLNDWVPSTLAPTTSAATVTIRSLHVVYIQSAIVADQVTVETNGSLAVDIGGSLTVNDGTGVDLTIQSNGSLDTRGLITNNGQVSVSGIVYVKDPATFAGSSFTYNAGSLLKYYANNISTTNVEFPSASGPAALDISPNSGGTITLHAARAIPTQFILGSGVLAAGSNLTLGNGCFVIRSNGSMTGTPNFSGAIDINYYGDNTSGPELPASPSALHNLTLGDAGTQTNLTLSNNITVNGVLDLSNWRLTTGANTAAIGSVTRGSGYVIGSLSKSYTAIGAKTYEVGTANGYSPVSVDATAGTFPAQFTVSATEGALPAIPNTNKLARYWTLTQNSGSVTANLTFNYLAGDVGGGSIANYQFIKKNGPTITTLSPTGTPTSTSAAINGVNSFSDWTLAEPLVATVNLSVSSNSSSEAAPAPITVTATLSSPAVGSQTVDLAVTGTNITAGDYTLAPTTITVPNGQTTGTAIFTVVDDAVSESTETSTITESNPSSGIVLGATTSQNITITDNDPVPETTGSVSGSNLTIDGGPLNDNLTISCSGGFVVISDPGNTLLAGSGMTQVDTHSIKVLATAIPGLLTVNGAGGNDHVSVDLTGCNFIAGGFTFNGGAGGIDSLVIQGGSQGQVTYNYTNGTPGSGSVVMSNFGTINYTGLEPITNTGTATDVIFNLPAGGTAATLADDGTGGNGLSTLSGATFESTTFSNPVGSLTINRGDPSDTVTVNALPDLTSSLTLGSSGGGEFGALTFNGAVALAANKDLSGFATGTISLPTAASDIATSGMGAISLTTARDISLGSGSSVITSNGPLTLLANQQAAPTAGNFNGVDINNGLVQATGSGVVTVKGKSGDAAAPVISGVQVQGGGHIIGGTGGLLTVTGTGGAGTAINTGFFGIIVSGAGSSIGSAGADVKVDGGSNATGSSFGRGISIVGGAVITAGSMGTVTVIGHGGNTAGGITSQNAGVVLAQVNSTITSSGGDVSVTGTAGGTRGFDNIGVRVAAGIITAGGNGNVTVIGQGGGTVAGVASDSLNAGVLVETNGFITGIGTGNVNIAGTGGGGLGAYNAGVIVEAGSLVSTPGTGAGAGTITIVGTGGAGPSQNYGVDLEGANPAVTSVNGNIFITGTAGAGGLANNSFALTLGYPGNAAESISSTGTGNLKVTADSVRIVAASESLNFGTNTVTFVPKTAGTLIDIGGPDAAGTLGLTDAELDRITAGTINIGDVNSGAVTVSANITRPASTIMGIASGANIDIAGGSVSTGGGNLNLQPATNVFASNSGVDVSTGAASTLGITSGKDLRIVINNTTPDSGYTQLNVAGRVNVTGVNLSLSGSPVLAAGDAFMIVNNDLSGDPVTGTFAGLPQGAVIPNFLGSGQNAGITYTGGDGNDVVLTVLPPTPTITPGGPTTFCPGGSVTLTSSSATGNQWYLNGNPIGGATSQPYIATASGNYTVVVTISGASSSPSTATTVTVNPLPPTPTITPGGPTTFMGGGSVTLTSSSATGNQWYKNGNPIGGATNQTYVATTTGAYTVVVTATCTSVPSAPTNVTATTPPISLVVTKTADTNDGICDADCSLREAIGAANFDPDVNTITFNIPPADPGCAGTCITLAGALPDLSANVNINGPVASQVTVQRSLAAPNFSVFTVSTGVTAAISRLTISQGTGTNGNVDLGGGPTPAISGGGIFNRGGTLTIDNCTITGNSLQVGTSVQTHIGAGVANISGTLSVVNSTLSNNEVFSDFTGGSGATGGGIFNYNGTASIVGSSISGNRTIAVPGLSPTAGAQGGGIYNYLGVLNLTNTTLSGNSAAEAPICCGVSLVNGGGIMNVFGTINSANSTVTANFVQGLSGTNNIHGGGVENAPGGGPFTTGPINLKNTIIAGNGFGNSLQAHGYDLLGFGFVSQGNNLIGTTDQSDFLPNGLPTDKTGTDAAQLNPLFAPLGNYGGPTQTHALLPGSPAINAGNNSGAPTNDQRGITRPKQTTVDIGAFESQGFTMAISGGNNQSTVVGTAFATPLTVSVASAFGEPVNGGIVTFTTPAAGASASLAATTPTISGGTTSTGTVTANATAGSYGVTANATGVASGVSFSLTNLRPSTSVVSINRVQPDPTNLSNVTWQITFANAVNGLTASNFSLVNTGLGGTPAIGSVVAPGGAPATTWNLTASTGTGNGTLGLNLVNDTGLTHSVTVLPSVGQVYTIDRTPPAVTINQAVGQADPTIVSPINFTVVFSEATTNFATGDVSFAGSTVGGTLVGTVTGSGTTYNVAVTGMIGNGTVVATVGAGVATDAAGNSNTPSTSADNSVLFAGSDDLTITKTDGVTSTPAGSTVTYTIVAANNGPNPATGATVTDIFPAGITNIQWTCTPAGLAACGALTSGTGNINQTVNLPVGGTVTYTAAATISPSATGVLSNTATVTPPVGMIDPNPANNTATDIDTLTAPSVFVIDDVTKLEGASGTTSFVFTVTKTGGTGFATAVQFQTQDGTATVANNDYQAQSGTLNFGPNETQKTITVLVNGDTAIEPNETFFVRLGINPVGALIGDVEGLGTIVNDDPTASPTPTPTPANRFEGDINRTASGVPGTGDGDVNVGDQIQYQRFLNGTDCPSASEQLRLDAGPRVTLGDGLLGSTDGTAIDAYARHDLSTDFDPNTPGWQPTPAGGPTSITNLGCTPPAAPEGEEAAAVAVAAAAAEGEAATAARIVRLIPARTRRNTYVTVDIEMAAQGNEAGTQFGLHFDPSVLAISDISGVNVNPDITLGANAPEGTTLNVNADDAANGNIGIVENLNAGAAAITAIQQGAIRIARVRFHVLDGATAGETRIAFDDTVLSRFTADTNGRSLAATYDQEGAVTVAATPGVRVSGKVTTPDGRGLRNATVTIVDASGFARTVMTSAFGYYAFDGVATGEHYTLAAASRQYRFASRTIEITDNLADLDFNGSE